MLAVVKMIKFFPELIAKMFANLGIWLKNLSKKQTLSNLFILGLSALQDQ